MFSSIKLWLGGAALAFVALLLAALKIQSSRLEKAKTDIATQKRNQQKIKVVLDEIKKEEKRAKKASAIHEKNAGTSASDDREWMRNRSGSNNDNKD